VADAGKTLLISGTGDVIEPEKGIIAIGSGGSYAYSAAMAYMDASKLTAKEIAERSLKIAASVCIYTNSDIHIEEIG
jgi:ATP-dependent HslUV protease subunit HslV